MDEIDQKQQNEINDLQKKDIAHDAGLSFLNKLYIGLFVVILALFVGGVILFPLISDREGNFNCPHEGCVHHAEKR